MCSWDGAADITLSNCGEFLIVLRVVTVLLKYLTGCSIKVSRFYRGYTYAFCATHQNCPDYQGSLVCQVNIYAMGNTLQPLPSVQLIQVSPLLNVLVNRFHCMLCILP